MTKRYKEKKTPWFILGIIAWLIWIGASYYVMLPVVNPHAESFWTYLALCVLLPLALLVGIREAAIQINGKGVSLDRKSFGGFSLALFGAILLIFCIVIVGGLAGVEIFHAKAYASILQTEEYDFNQDMDQASAVSEIALMDTSSAIRLGNREIGSLSDLVSQYDVSESYAQIDYQGAPVKVSALDYAGFFKWLGNKEQGVPGYVTVDPVGQSAEYVELDQGMKYVPSAYFNSYLERHIRFAYPTAIFGNTHFELDEEGNPYYVASVYDYTIGLFGGETVKGAIICDPVTGDCQYYAVKDVPTWVDEVFDGEVLTQQYNWSGELGNGYWNSVFGKKGCKKCTSTYDSDADDYVADYGYVAKDGDIWIYTGVTSVNDDASNIGFVLINQRTAESHFYTIAGADENSAMSAAEGEVQEKGYIASFPSLINVDQEPTYVMVLKDGSGIVKLYAMVNVEQYNLVTTASSLDECFSKYRTLLGLGGTEDAADIDQTDAASSQTETPEENLGDPEERELLIASIQYVDIEGNTYVYLEAEDGSIYRQKFADNEELIGLRVGDHLTVSARKAESGTYYLESFSQVEESSDQTDVVEETVEDTGAQEEE